MDVVGAVDDGVGIVTQELETPWPRCDFKAATDRIIVDLPSFFSKGAASKHGKGSVYQLIGSLKGNGKTAEPIE